MAGNPRELANVVPCAGCLMNISMPRRTCWRWWSGRGIDWLAAAAAGGVLLSGRGGFPGGLQPQRR